MCICLVNMATLQANWPSDVCPVGKCDSFMAFFARNFLGSLLPSAFRKRCWQVVFSAVRLFDASHCCIVIM